MFRAFRRLKVGGSCTGFLDDLLQYFRILQHRAGTQVIVIERLPFMIFQEKRLLQAFQQGFFINIRT